MGFIHMMGACENNTFGSGCAKTLPSLSQRAPSKYNPRQYAPSSGFSNVFCAVFSMNSKSNDTASIGMVYFLEKFCYAPVKKAVVKNKPLNQNTTGGSVSNHFFMNANRASKSVMYGANGFKLG